MAESRERRGQRRTAISPEGGKPVDVSLDLALEMAFEYARNNREFYGRYATVELIWQFVRTRETQEYYEVRLSYRPSGNFRGRPGVEHFIIDKKGAIRFRQIISEPRPLWRSLRLPAAIGALLVVGVVFGVLFNAGVLSPSSSSRTAAEPVVIALTPDVPAHLESRNGAVVVDVPAASVDEASQLTYRSLSLDKIPVLPASFRPTSKVFELETDALLLKPITITLEISAGDALLAEDNEANIVIQRHQDGQWTPLATRVEFGASTATGQVDQLGIFALTVKEPTVISSPKAYRIGEAYYEDGHYQLAIDEFTVAIELDPNVRDYYWYRGIANVGLANLPQAIDDYSAAIALDPTSGTLYALRGFAYSRGDLSERALLDLDEAIRLEPDLAMAYLIRGIAYTKMSQDQIAESDYDKACQLDKDFCR